MMILLFAYYAGITNKLEDNAYCQIRHKIQQDKS